MGSNLVAALGTLPPWLGSVPAWTTLIIVLGYITIQWVRNRPVMEQQKIDERLNIKSGYTDRIRRLEETVASNWQQCEEEKRLMREQIDQLQDKIRNEAEQRTQSEISLVNTLIQVVDAPQLRQILKALEDKQVRLLQVRAIGGPLAKEQKE